MQFCKNIMVSSELVNNGSILFLLAASSLLGACDDGRIYDESVPEPIGQGKTVVMKGMISGSDDYYYDSGYSVALAAFGDEDDYALVSRNLSDGDGEVLLGNVPVETSTVEVCLINRLRERVFTYASADINGLEERGMVFEAGTLDVGRFSTVSGHIFSTSCAQCHGATGKAAAGLNLMPENAYEALVDVPSTVIDGECRVKPGNASASTLWQTVATGISTSWAFNHAVILEEKDKSFIRSWIDSGAEK